MTNDPALEQKLARALALSQNDQQTDQAILLFQEILQQWPTQPFALHGLGMVYAQQRNFSKAIFYLEQAVKAAPQIAEFHNNLGNAYKAANQPDDALRHYHEALRIKPRYPQVHNNLGSLYYRLGDYKQAADHFEKSLRMDPLAVDTHYNLANCYIQQDRLLDAVSHFQEVLKLRPEHLGALHNLGITLSALKHFQEAKPLLEQVIEREPNNVDALFHLGIIYSALAEETKAKSCYERVLILNPQHANAHHNLATIYLHLNQPDLALKQYQLALIYEPNNKTAEHMIAALMGKTLESGAPLEYTRALFDQYAYNYEQHVKEKLLYQVPFLLRDAVTPFIAPGKELWTVLDLGCGTGLCAPFFADVAGKLIGVDISPNMIDVARQRGGYYKLFVMDALTFLKGHEAEFELIISADVFVYFGELDNIFKACSKALKPKGLFCFSIEKLTAEEVGKDLTHPQFQLRKTGRYAHHPDYIHQLAMQHHFTIGSEKQAVLRHQEEGPISGDIYVLIRAQ
ncbi:MAG: tetratricopeptide repeat protein [Candidatus Berkiellales bacterium]